MLQRRGKDDVSLTPFTCDELKKIFLKCIREMVIEDAARPF